MSTKQKDAIVITVNGKKILNFFSEEFHLRETQNPTCNKFGHLCGVYHGENKCFEVDEHGFIFKIKPCKAKKKE